MRPLRVNFFSPLPPSPSGIADYSHALAEPLGRLVDLQLIGSQEIPAREQQTPEGLGAFQKAEIEKWWPLVKAAGISLE